MVHTHEGIRPRERHQLKAHCPVPVFFCFDFVEVMSRDDASFSNGNMAGSFVEYDNTLEFFEKLRFDLIYADRPSTRDERNFRVVSFDLHPGGKLLSSVRARFEYVEDGATKPRTWQGQSDLTEPLDVEVKGANVGHVLAYSGRVDFRDIPF